MQALLEFAPLVAFFVGYRLNGLYTGTAALMVAILPLLALDLIRQRRIAPMHALSAGLYLVFGTATLLLHNQRYIQWKPTVFFWLVSVAFLLSFWIGERPLVERLLGSALEGQIRVPERLWRALNWQWVAFCAVLGAANLAVALHASESTWVNFKVFGLTIASVLFVAMQTLWLSRRALPASAEDSSAPT
jgi:intracellular septation protein